MLARLFGRYEIRQEIGRGGMARVYLAYDPAFRRQVAVKVLPPHFLDNPLLRARFEREARLIATIEHPAIVPVYDFGEQEGQLYLVMRYMPGGSLAAVIRQGPFSLVQAAELLTLLAPALDAVHGRGIVHRDLKPGNILLDAFGNPALSDFGIAHLSEATVELTGEAIIGTPAYMSPEQVRGEAALDGRSDVYSLGIILFEMLTSRQPYQAATPMSVAMRHLTDSVPQICQLRPELPEPLQAVFDRALAKDRDRRYLRATDLSYELRVLVEAFPNGAPGPARSVPAESPPVNHPVPDTPPVTRGIASSADATEADSQRLDRALPPSNPGPPGPTTPLAVLPANLPAAALASSPQEIVTEIEANPAQPVTTLPGPARPAMTRAAPAKALILLPALLLLLVLSYLGIQYLRPARVEPSPPAAFYGGALSLTSTVSPGPATAAFPLSAATPEMTLPPTALSTPALVDDFSTPANGWPQGSQSGGGYSYRDNAYLISAFENGAVYWAAPDYSFSDLRVSVAAERISGDQGYYGLLCRIQDAENYYYFIVRPDGYFTIGRYQAASFSPLTPGGWTYHPSIQNGAATNRLEAECVGDRLRLSANGALLGEVRDSAFASGKPGLVVAALDSLGFQATFDNFIIYPAAR